jgi:hypothetical protein
MPNWSGKNWKIEADFVPRPDPNFYKQGRDTNKFYLAPEIYTGADVTITSREDPNPRTYTAGTLCFRVKPVDSGLTTNWDSVVLFQAGTKPFPGRPKPVGNPMPSDIQRLEGKASIPAPPPPDNTIKPTVFLYLTTAEHPTLEVRVVYGGGGDGWTNAR